MLINVEIRWPWEEQVVEEYDYRWAVKSIIDVVEKYKMGYKVKFSCFSNVPLEGLQLESDAETRTWLIHSLRNRRGRDALNYETIDGHSGVTLMSPYITEERIVKMHEEGKMSGVWMKPPHEYESFELWHKIFTYDDGITFYFSDYSE